MSVLLFSSCKESDSKKVDISKVVIPFETVPFYKELFALDTNDLDKQVHALGQRHPDFSTIYFNELTGFAPRKSFPFEVSNSSEAGLETDPSKIVFLNSLKHFLSYKDYRGLYDTVIKKFPDTKETDRQLHDLFRHIRYYFPEERWSRVYYFISGLNQWSAVTVDTLLGVGLDMHLGKDYPFYASVQLPDYQVQHCEPEFIPINAARAIYENKFPLQAESKTLLDLMLDKGKEMLFVEYVLPEVHDSLLMGYTSDQWKWVEEHEAMIWSYFKKQDLLYSTQWQQILRYINEGPSSTGMPKESPGNIGTWIGWQIVRKYIQEHPEVKWNDWIRKPVDSQLLLREANYKPS